MSTITYRFMKNTDEDQVRQLCYRFWENEPVARVVGLEIPRECELSVEYMLQEARTGKISIVAEDTASSKIVGVCIYSVISRGGPDIWTFPKNDPNCQKMMKIERIYDQITMGPDHCDYFNVDRAIIAIATIVEREFQRNGIALRMGQLGVEIGSYLGIPLAISDCTSDYSRKIAKHLGFQIVKEVQLSDDVTGEPLVNSMDNKRIIGSLHTLALSAHNKDNSNILALSKL